MNRYQPRISSASAVRVCQERLTIVANYENVIADKDAKIAELRECLMAAVREKCPFTRMSCRYGEHCDYECGTEKWRKALKGINNATK